ncbi:MAG: Ig domain-containing protein [Oscillospiraceae bacterium]|nr:Ig domain-containing protein [Oscillospiraceae bacterium]
MTNKKVTRRALLMSVTSLLICISMLLGTTFAWFTDEVTSGVNQIVAGNLDVELYHTNPATAANASDEAKKVGSTTKLFQTAIGTDVLWEPEAMTYETFEVRNVGTLALKYQLMLNDVLYNIVTWAADNTAGVAAGEHNLTEVIQIGIIDGATAPTRADIRAAATQTIKQAMDSSWVAKTSALEQGASQSFTVVLYWPQSSADNNWNLKNTGWSLTQPTESWSNAHAKELAVEFGIKLLATQYTSESDSFDNQYDASATTSNNTQFAVSSATAPVKNGEDTKLTVADVATATVKSTSTLSNSAGNIDSSKLSSLTLEVEEEDSNEAVIAITAGDSEVMGFDVSLYATTVTTVGTESTSETSAVTGSSELIVATINIGAGKEITAVYHRTDALSNVASGTNEYYTYDSATGILTLYVKSFSPFAVRYTVPATGITLDKSSLSVVASRTETLTATVSPANTTDKVEWSSSDTSVATVENGVVTGIAAGTATITAKAGDMTATCEVSIEPRITLTYDNTTTNYFTVTPLGYIKTASSGSRIMNDLYAINGNSSDNKNVVIKLYDDIALNDNASFPGEGSLLQSAAALSSSTDKLNITIDLNGHTITGNVNELSNHAKQYTLTTSTAGGILNVISLSQDSQDRQSTFTLNIIDSSEDQSGAIINNGTAPALFVGNYKVDYWNVVINISCGGFYSAGTKCIEKNEYNGAHTNTTTVNITGGTFSSDPTSFVDTTKYTVIANDSENPTSWTVTEKDSIIVVGADPANTPGPNPNMSFTNP